MKNLLYLFSFIFFSGCAAKFKTGFVSQYPYQTSQIKDSIEYALMFDVLQFTDNKRFATIEKKKQLELVAVKVINHSNKPLTINEQNFAFTSGGLQVLNVDGEEYYKKVKKKAGLFLLWCLASPTWQTENPSNVDYIDYNGNPVYGWDTYSIPIGLPIGIANFIIARKANKKFKQHLTDNNLLPKTIEPKGTTYGYIYVRKAMDRDFKLERE